MATDINSVTLTGRLVRDAELKYATSGNAIVRFSLAVNRSKRNPDGSWAEETSYFDCVYFGKPAEAVNSYLQKGRQITVLGELRQSRWEQDGQTRSRVEVYINNLTLGSTATNRGGDQNGSFGGDGYQQSAPRQNYSSQNSYAKPQAPQYQAQPVHGPEGFQDDDIPF